MARDSFRHLGKVVRVDPSCRDVQASGVTNYSGMTALALGGSHGKSGMGALDQGRE